jgi:alpha-1,2-mannosyltransferase
MDIADPIPSAPTGLTPAQDLRRALVMLALWTVYAIWHQWGHWGEDLSALYIAGHLWQTGQSDLIYAAPPGFFGGAAASWAPVMADLGISDKIAFPYIYPPLWAVLIAPVSTVLGPQGFADAVTLFQMPMLAASVLMAARLMRPAGMPLHIWAVIGVATLLVSMQSYAALWHNQPTITVSFLILLAFTSLDRGRPVAAGAALALAAAIKLTPAAFVLIFLIDRQYRAIAAFAVIGGALGLLSLVLAGLDMHLTFVESLRAVRGATLLNAVNVSLLPALMSLGSVLGLAAPFDLDAETLLLAPVPGWLTLAISATALVLVAAFLNALRSQPARLRRSIGVLVLSLILALFGPLGWLHYYLMPLLLLPGLFGLFNRSTATALVLPVAILALRPTLFELRELHGGTAIYVWLSCAAWLSVLAALFVIARQRK